MTSYYVHKCTLNNECLGIYRCNRITMYLNIKGDLEFVKKIFGIFKYTQGPFIKILEFF